MPLINIRVALILVFICSVSGSLLQNTIKKIEDRKDEDSYSCNVNINRQLIRCETEPNDDIVPEETFCSFIEEDDVQVYFCDKGYLLYQDYSYKGTTNDHYISKRFFDILVGAIVGTVVVGAVLCMIFCHPNEKGVPEPNHPPEISCPSVNDVTALELQETAMVTWTIPTASDRENKLTPTSPYIDDKSQLPGSSFGEGSHIVTYTAEDSAGQRASCSIRFKIIVIKCTFGNSLSIENGRVDCSKDILIYGTTCEFVCNTGYQLSSASDSTKKCSKNGSSLIGIWQPAGVVTCEKKECSSPPELCDVKWKCTDENRYESVCYPECLGGFSTDSTRNIRCDGDTWTGLETIEPCKDIEPPEFLYCPETITEFANVDRTKTVDWDVPTATDNSENAAFCSINTGVSVSLTTGDNPGTSFNIGHNNIIYTATDSSGNEANCSFSVIVNELSCDPLVIGDKFVLNSCPDGFSFGSTCSFDCFLSYKLVGDVNVTCQKDSNDENKAIWDWQSGNESYCEKLRCPELPAPAGGALACSEALGNQICTMSCSDKYQVAKGTSKTYVCNDDQVWIQGIPPNCTDRVHPSNAIQPGELFYYYSGDCSDPGVQDGIKQNFVDNMKNLEGTDGWKNVCPEYCNVDGVTVTCGPLNGRRKRGLQHYMYKRETKQITVNFNVVSQWDTEKGLWGNDDDLTILSDFIKREVENGTFDYVGTTTGDMFVGWIELSCPIGQEPVYDDEGKCVGCPPGQYLEDSNCINCPKGSYQDKEYQINCTPCPDGKSTKENGSSSLMDCIERCPPGTYSVTGVLPCSPCSHGYFQPDYESTMCLQCDSGKSTDATESSKESDCKAMDFTFKSSDAMIKLPSLTDSIYSFSLGFHMKCSNKSIDKVLTKLGNFAWTIGDLARVAISGYSFHHDLEYDVELHKWTHYCLTWDHPTKEIKLYGNGKLLASNNFSSVSQSMATIQSGSVLEIFATESICSFSGLFLVTDVLTENTLEAKRNTCEPLVDNAAYTMDDVFKSQRNGTDISSSRCDAIDECTKNPCGQRNTCVNKRGGYECICSNGYTGVNCEIPPDFCASNNCSNGATCLSQFANYTCQCSQQYTGVLCDTEIVHGNWGAWTTMTECSVSCGGGTKTRIRYCNNPAPDVYGTDCNGNNTSMEECNNKECPVCPIYMTIYQYKNNFNCTTLGDSISCVVSCQSGYTFVKDYYPLDTYECGPHTKYSWNSKPPPCTSVKSPIVIKSTSVVEYSIDCAEEEPVISALSAKLDELQCVKNSTCRVQTNISGCSSKKRKKRSNTNVEVTIQMYADLAGNKNLGLHNFYANKIISPELYTLLHTYSDMALSLEQLNNTDILTLDVNGNLITADLSTLNVTSNVACPDGTVNEELVCADCPEGTYWSNGFCVMCPEGYYQNVSGQLQCEQCPDGYTTQFIASRNETECSVPKTSTTGSPSTEESDDGSSDSITMVVIITSIAVVVVLVVIMVATLKYRQYLRKLKRCESRKSIGSIANLNMVKPENINGKVIGDGKPDGYILSIPNKENVISEALYDLPDDVRYTQPPASCSWNQRQNNA